MPFVRRAIHALILPFALSACSADRGPDASEDDLASAFTGTPNDDIGQLFMVDHFGVTAEGFPDVGEALRRKNLGAVILWNPTNASGETARQMVAHYASIAHAANRPELFVAADQEERGTERFGAKHGFTSLAEGDTLGRVVAAKGDAHVCDLHARITSRELASVGMNMALGTVSDIFTRDSGTPGMFRTRAISSDPNVVASCIRAMLGAYTSEGHVVYITKHFPGLGNASGNTDVDPSVHSLSDTAEKMERELMPYRGATAFVNAAPNDPTSLFGTMISHASYKILDASSSPATLSSHILHDFLRAPATTDVPGGVDRSGQAQSFKGMGLRGLTVSDAFWTWGATKNLTAMQKRRLMARALLAGMDVLMIAKVDFAGAWDYFQQLFAGQLPEDEQAALVADAHATDFATLRAAFAARVAESARRVRDAKAKVGPSASFVKTGPARAASADLTPDYERLTQ
jgi:beta-glucosidase-like glycosyl hydrolase